jgi:hypothetical protein
VDSGCRRQQRDRPQHAEAGRRVLVYLDLQPLHLRARFFPPELGIGQTPGSRCIDCRLDRLWMRTDFQMLNASHLGSMDALVLKLAESIGSPLRSEAELTCSN